MARWLFFVVVAFATLPVHADDRWVCPESGKQFCTGAMPTAASELAASPMFKPPGRPPKHVAYVPSYRSAFGNDRYGVCVTAEEAFAKSCWIAGVQPQIEIPEDEVIRWAQKHGWLNGASLSPVIDAMEREGFECGPQLYNDGNKLRVDCSDHDALRAAIALGPVKIAMRASTLGRGAGSRDGWYSLGGHSNGSDHCVSLCGYGKADWLFGELGVPLPSAVQSDCDGYLLYTWGTIGFVDEAWVDGNCREAWLRDPTTIGIPPIVAPKIVDTIRWGFVLVVGLVIVGGSVAAYVFYRRWFG